MFSTMRRVVESFGYEEYAASVLEPTELYTAKSSDEIVREQTYTFEDRGGRSVTLRPEMTPTVARMVGARRRDLGMPLRLYSIPNLFRYERTQRGRMREHWQLNVDLFGATESAADEEIVVVAYRLLRELGADDSMFQIRVNNRQLLQRSLNAALKDSSQYMDAVQLIDRKEKMPRDEFDAAWAELSGVAFDEAMKPDSEIITFIQNLKRRGVENAVYGPNIVRGFNYYTGTVFEIFDTDPENNRSMMGGGRYDNLVGQYANEDLPAVGFGLGDITLRLFLESHHLLPVLKPKTVLYLAPLGNIEHAARAADTLRENGVCVALGMRHTKVADHIKAALKLGVPLFAVFGDDENTSHTLTVKVLASEEEVTMNIKDVPLYAKDHA
jgi:histidyl-tRNA synthetase